MILKLKKLLIGFEKLIRGFNFAFFLISIVFWLILTIAEISTKPFDWPLLWSAFNVLYGQFNFKIGCILLIIFNGLLAIRQWIFAYYELKEYGEHIWTLGKVVGKKNNI